MPFRGTHPISERLLTDWRDALGRDADSYGNHVRRVLAMAADLSGATDEDLDLLAIAAAFHDVGIWLDGTFDYLEPSVARAAGYLRDTGRTESTDEVATIIRQHHRMRPWRHPDGRLVEAFRRADWLDVCLMALPSRVPRTRRRALVRTFPRRGFHRRLLVIGARWWGRHPLRPLPMLKL